MIDRTIPNKNKKIIEQNVYLSSLCLFISAIIMLRNNFISISLLTLFLIIITSFYYFDNKRKLINAIFIIVTIPVLYIYNNNKYSTHPILENFTSIDGFLTQDSTISEGKSCIYTICTNNLYKDGLKLRCKSIIKLRANDENPRGIYKDRISAYGIKKIRDNFYQAENIKIEKRSFLNKIRCAFLINAENRIIKVNKYYKNDKDFKAHLLSLKILFSRQLDGLSDTKLLFSELGVSHVFALSGMHLAFIAKLSILFAHFFTKNKTCTKFITFALVNVYFFLSSRSPSIIRSYFMLALNTFFDIDIKFSLVTAYCLHLLFYPMTCFSESFELSYTALCGIIVFMPFFSSIFPKKITSIFIASISAAIVSASLTIKYFQQFSALGIILTPPMAIIAMIFLINGLLLYLFPANPVSSVSLHYVYIFMEKLLKFALNYKITLTITTYFIMLFIIFVLSLCQVMKMQKRRKEFELML